MSADPLLYDGPRGPQLIDGLRVRRDLAARLPADWSVPHPFGPDGWWYTSEQGYTIILSAAQRDGIEWIHASMKTHAGLPSYAELVGLHAAVFPGYAYQVFAPPPDARTHPDVLHLYGRCDGLPGLPLVRDDLGR